MKRFLIIPMAFLLMAGDGQWLIQPEFSNTQATDFFEFPRDQPDIFYFAKTACEGSCPVYQIYLYPSGYLEYTGYQDVKNLGFSAHSWDPKNFKEINKVLDSIQIYKLENKYSNAGGGNVCGEYWHDSPSTVFALSKDYEVKGVYFSYGCKNFPDEQKLKFAVKKIEQILGVDFLTGKE